MVAQLKNRFRPGEYHTVLAVLTAVTELENNPFARFALHCIPVIVYRYPGDGVLQGGINTIKTDA